MLNKFQTSALFAALLSITTVALAKDPVPEQPRWFQVELIFFEPLESTATGEIWPEPEIKSETDQPELIVATELAAPLQPIIVQDNPDITPRAFQLLNPSNFAMSDLTQQLLDSRQYRVLSHIAWRQPTVKLVDSPAVHVHDELMQEDALIPVTNEPLVLNNLPDPVEQLETEIKQRRFDAPSIEYFKLVESRRMRSRKIHYLDHPYFGIIALITPYESK